MRVEAYVKKDTLKVFSENLLFEANKQIKPKNNLKLVPEKCALVIVDMNKYFASKDGPAFLPASCAIIPKIKKLLDLWREKNGAIVFTKHGHKDKTDLGMFGKFYNSYIKSDSPNAQIIDDLKPLEQELIIKKNTYDAFYSTNLNQELQKKEISQVLITGVLTHLCCETTARSAFCRGYEVYAAIDAMASCTLEAHRDSVINMARSVAILCMSEEIVK